MGSAARSTRQKISTTISPVSIAYLERLVDTGMAQNLAEAIDLAIDRLLAFENRERLEDDTTAYFANLTEDEAEAERSIEMALHQSSVGFDVDS